MELETAVKAELFTKFKSNVEAHALPELFTFPFYYEPHDLCILAAKELQESLTEENGWQYNFGLDNKRKNGNGKMFGVLIVQNEKNELGYLRAFSGKLEEKDRPEGFVPHVIHLEPGNNFFETGVEHVDKINLNIKTLECSEDFIVTEKFAEEIKNRATADLSEEKKRLNKAKSKRKQRLDKGILNLKDKQLQILKEQLILESLKKKFYFKHLSLHWEAKIAEHQKELDKFLIPLNDLKGRRKKLSADLQQQLFNEYQFLNIKGEVKSLNDLFKGTVQYPPPAGSGDCAAPKLLQHAFKYGLKPVAMAEFWWGTSPKSNVRKHGQFYPACIGKCQPILGHMLEGLTLEPNPIIADLGSEKTIETVFEDEHMAVINKPFGLLSVPGTSIKDSVALRVKQKYPNATGPLVVHRLDQATSGLMLIAKSAEVHKVLQQQFIKRTVKKRYTAILNGTVPADEGQIDLPLRVDFHNRPQQMVCYEHGKRAITNYKVIERINDQTRIHFFPITGRTHQLRMHAAHSLGLNTPIIGDTLYGTKDNRLYLHAEHISFKHPVSHEELEFNVEAQF